MPSIQTSLLTGVPAWVGQMLPGLCMEGVRAYIPNSPAEKPVNADPASGVRDERGEKEGPRGDLTGGEKPEEPGGWDRLQEGVRPGRHAVHRLGLFGRTFPLLESGVQDESAGGDTAGKVTSGHRNSHGLLLGRMGSKARKQGT